MYSVAKNALKVTDDVVKYSVEPPECTEYFREYFKNNETKFPSEDEGTYLAWAKEAYLQSKKMPPAPGGEFFWTHREERKKEIESWRAAGLLDNLGFKISETPIADINAAHYQALEDEFRKCFSTEAEVRKLLGIGTSEGDSKKVLSDDRPEPDN